MIIIRIPSAVHSLHVVGCETAVNCTSVEPAYLILMQCVHSMPATYFATLAKCEEGLNAYNAPLTTAHFVLAMVQTK